MSDRQYGFRKGCSTELALLDLTTDIANDIENKKYTVGVFLDCSKAFDSLDHSILLNKLFHYGIRGQPYQWFKNYLSDRHQYVSVNGHYSSNLPILKGVPQGSILGPLLFNIFVNDIVSSSSTSKFIIYADDTTLLYSHSDIKILNEIINVELKSIEKWYSANQLQLNLTKTCYIVFGPKIKTNLVNIDLSIDDIPIRRVNSTKLLGVVITSNLSWLDHINLISNIIY